jgi:hypothetical protein
MKLRRFTPGERALAAEVFGPALDSSRAIIVTGAPTGGTAFVLSRWMIFPVEVADFAAEPVQTQGWFVHELTHVWQFQRRPLWTLTSWLKVLVTGGYGPGQPGYRYTLPVGWDRLNLEQQARVMEHGWLAERGVRAGAMPAGTSAADYPLQAFIGQSGRA